MEFVYTDPKNVVVRRAQGLSTCVTRVPMAFCMMPTATDERTWQAQEHITELGKLLPNQE